jgi:hypothetical protein
MEHVILQHRKPGDPGHDFVLSEPGPTRSYYWFCYCEVCKEGVDELLEVWERRDGEVDTLHLPFVHTTEGFLTVSNTLTRWTERVRSQERTPRSLPPPWRPARRRPIPD